MHFGRTRGGRCRGSGGGVIALAQEAQIGAVNVRRVGLENVVGEENVGDLVLGHVGLHVFGEVAGVDDVDLGERVEEVAGQGVAEAVFEDDEATMTGSGGADDGQTGVTAHECAVGAGTSVAIVLKIDAAVRTTFADDAIILVDGVVGVGGRVGDVAGNVVDEVFGGIFQRDVFGIAVHTAHVTVNHLAIIGTQWFERDAGHFGEGFGGVESAERRPVVVGAQIDGLGSVTTERGVDVDGLHARIE